MSGSAYMREWRKKNREHYNTYQREYKRKLRSKQKQGQRQ